MSIFETRYPDHKIKINSIEDEKKKSKILHKKMLKGDKLVNHRRHVSHLEEEDVTKLLTIQ